MTIRGGGNPIALAPLSVAMRVVYGVLALPIVLPPESFAGGHYVNLAGVAAAAVLLGIDYVRRETAAKAKVAS